MGFHSYLRPKTIMDTYLPDPIGNLDFFFAGIEENHALFQKGWEIWKKYAPQFCGENLFFDFFEHHNLELRYAKIPVINRRLVLEIFDQYEDLCREFFPSLKDKDALFNALINDEEFKRKFYSRDDLMGICLGYGQNNAALFQQMSSLLTSMGELGYTPQIPSPDHLESLEKQWNQLRKSFSTGFKDHSGRKFLFNKGLKFRVDPSTSETAILKSKYTQLHKKLTQEYGGADFLQKTLELIILADQ